MEDNDLRWPEGTIADDWARVDEFLPSLVQVHQDQIVGGDYYDLRFAMAKAIAAIRAEAKAEAGIDCAKYHAAAVAEAKAEGAQEERDNWMSCARVDALMEGPHLKGWSRSDLDRMWRRCVV